VDAVRVALERNRPVREMGKKEACDANVKGNDRFAGEASGRIDDSVGIGNDDRPPADLQRSARAHAHEPSCNYRTNRVCLGESRSASPIIVVEGARGSGRSARRTTPQVRN
jgi:hypothetical protein